MLVVFVFLFVVEEMIELMLGVVVVVINGMYVVVSGEVI